MPPNLDQSPDRAGGFPFSLLLSALLHGVLLLLPLGLAGPPASAFGAPPRLNPPLLVSLLGPLKPAMPPLVAGSERSPESGEVRPRPVELASSDHRPSPAGPAALLASADYHPASSLTVPPGLHTLGAVEPPPEQLMAGSGRLVVELFLNEAGEVDHWQLIEQTAPPAFREHVLKTFLAARYTPGRLFEQAVKSRFKLEATLAPEGK